MRVLSVIVVLLCAVLAFFLPKDGSMYSILKIVCIVILMMGVMRLMSKVSSKGGGDE